jgi:REP-associated tyrosine transposase
VPRRRPHYYGYNHLHYLTANVYQRARVLDSDRFKLNFVQTLGDLREELGFRIVGYVLMPEHCHLLLWPSDLANPAQIMQKLSERTANFILRTLRRNLAHWWCRKMLRCFELPPTVHHHARYRVSERGGYDMNIWSEKKRQQKLTYMHNNPVKTRLSEPIRRLAVVELAVLLSGRQLDPVDGPHRLSLRGAGGFGVARDCEYEGHRIQSLSIRTPCALSGLPGPRTRPRTRSASALLCAG